MPMKSIPRTHTIPFRVSFTSTVETRGTVPIPAEVIEGLPEDEARDAALSYLYTHGFEDAPDLCDEDMQMLDDTLEIDFA